jgi:hypothetical protein
MRGHVHALECCRFGREMTSGFDSFADTGIQALNGVGVDHTADLLLNGSTCGSTKAASARPFEIVAVENLRQSTQRAAVERCITERLSVRSRLAARPQSVRSGRLDGLSPQFNSDAATLGTVAGETYLRRVPWLLS